MTICPNCGAPLKGESCGYCGTNLSSQNKKPELIYKQTPESTSADRLLKEITERAQQTDSMLAPAGFLIDFAPEGRIGKVRLLLARPKTPEEKKGLRKL